MTLARDCASIWQNSELLHESNFSLARVDAPITVPSLLKERWLYRVDLTLYLRRAIIRTFPVRNIVKANVEIITQKATSDGSVVTDTQGFVGP